eukprot:Pompholyxophrys_punicea_v1_NODE_677_length_1477_cov_2.786217.p1 type:complete len:133 gc:universal NODE_677_length_1477_cov_2.786217:485-87(-)
MFLEIQILGVKHCSKEFNYCEDLHKFFLLTRKNSSLKGSVKSHLFLNDTIYKDPSSCQNKILPLLTIKKQTTNNNNKKAKERIDKKLFKLLIKNRDLLNASMRKRIPFSLVRNGLALMVIFSFLRFATNKKL